MSFEVFIGKQIYRLTVIAGPTKGGDGRVRWKCKCRCGKTKIIRDTHLKPPYVRSCGCLLKENALFKGKNSSILKLRHEEYRTEFASWQTMLQRCYRKDAINYERYGGRGIRVCKRWKNSFLNFYKDMGKKPTAKHSIDRINNSKSYSPKNCKWSTPKEQCKNRRLRRALCG